jgi:hypothetical protein
MKQLGFEGLVEEVADVFDGESLTGPIGVNMPDQNLGLPDEVGGLPVDALSLVFSRGEMEAILGVFGRIEVAEEEIERYMEKATDEKTRQRIDDAFLGLQPTPVLKHSPAIDRLYRGYVRELLQRILDGEDTRPGTYAEIAVVMSEVSQVTPLSKEASTLYFRSIVECGLGHVVEEFASRHEMLESLYRHTTDEIEREVKRKLRQEGRVL